MVILQLLYALFFLLDAPIVSISPPSPPIIHVGDNYLLLLCNAKGLPIPTVQWFLGDKAIKGFTELYEQAYYVPTTSPHKTVYTCVSKNKAGGEIRTVKSNVTVTVQCKRHYVFNTLFSFLLNI